MGDRDEDDRRDEVDQQRQHVLEGIQTLKVTWDEDGQEGHEEDALRGPEVATVDGRQEDRDCRCRTVEPLWSTSGQQPREARLQRHQDAGDGDEDRDDPRERTRRKHEQEACAGRPAQHGGDPQGADPCALSGQFASIADDATR